MTTIIISPVVAAEQLWPGEAVVHVVCCEDPTTTLCGERDMGPEDKGEATCAVCIDLEDNAHTYCPLRGICIQYADENEETD